MQRGSAVALNRGWLRQIRNFRLICRNISELVQDRPMVVMGRQWEVTYTHLNLVNF